MIATLPPQVHFTDQAWLSDASRWASREQYRDSCLLNDQLPIVEPDGRYNVLAMQMAAHELPEMTGDDKARRDAACRLMRLLRLARLSSPRSLMELASGITSQRAVIPSIALRLAAVRVQMGEVLRRADTAPKTAVQVPVVMRDWSQVVYDEAKHPRGANGRWIGGAGLNLQRELYHLHNAIQSHREAAWTANYHAGGGKAGKAAEKAYLAQASFGPHKGITALKAREAELKQLIIESTRHATPKELLELQALYHHYRNLAWWGPEALRHLPPEEGAFLRRQAEITKAYLDAYNRRVRAEHKAAGRQGPAPTIKFSVKAEKAALAALPNFSRARIEAHLAPYKDLDATLKAQDARQRDEAHARWLKEIEARKEGWKEGDNPNIDAWRKEQEEKAQRAIPQPRAPDSTLDQHGQQMPFTQAQFEEALTSLKPFDQHGQNRTGTAEINGVTYVIKDLTANGETGRDFWSYEQARNEAATVAALRALGLGDLGPAQAFHLADSSGKHYAVLSVVPGDPAGLHPFESLAQTVPNIRLGPLVLVEYVTGMADRHDFNIMYDATSNRLREIDFGYGLIDSRGLPYSYARALWSHRIQPNARMWDVEDPDATAPRMVFLRHVVQGIVDHKDAALKALDAFDLTPSERQAFADRLDIMRQWLDNTTGDLTLQGLQDTIDAFSASSGAAA